MSTKTTEKIKKLTNRKKLTYAEYLKTGEKPRIIYPVPPEAVFVEVSEDEKKENVKKSN